VIWLTYGINCGLVFLFPTSQLPSSFRHFRGTRVNFIVSKSPKFPRACYVLKLGSILDTGERQVDDLFPFRCDLY
jgi:hypothetical protein